MVVYVGLVDVDIFSPRVIVSLRLGEEGDGGGGGTTGGWYCLS